MTTLELIPAIDLRAGQCVRLFQGDFGRETVFGRDPLAVARHWEELGASRIHVVDLDGARSGQPVQLDLVAAIARTVQIPIELGGGLRTPEHVASALAAGVERVVLGTAAIGGRGEIGPTSFRRRCLDQHGDRVVIGLDARDGRLAVRGWVETTQLDAFTFAADLVDEGFQRIVYTDIQRDGALSGPNLDHLRRLTGIANLAIIASGGISSIDDLLGLSATGVEAAIVGQALYTAAIDLPEAISALRSVPSPS